MGIIDYDVVEQSNLHRQVVHPEANVGISKSLSIKREVLRLVLIFRKCYLSRTNFTYVGGMQHWNA